MSITPLAEEAMQALENLGYPIVTTCRMPNGSYGAAAWKRIEDFAWPTVSQWKCGGTRLDALWRLLEAVAG